jgi:predicted nucleic acid-binding Zn ribbon protein
MTMKSSNEYTLKQAIAALIDQYKIEEHLNETVVINDWEKIVGKMIARHTSNMHIKKRILFVELDNAALRNELSYAKTKLILAINKSLNSEAIDDIVFS